MIATSSHTAMRGAACESASGMVFQWSTLPLQSSQPHSWPQVYDSAKEFKLCGAGLLIGVNGLAALEAIRPELKSNLQAQGRANAPGVMYDASGGMQPQPARQRRMLTAWWHAPVDPGSTIRPAEAFRSKSLNLAHSFPGQLHT